jgi:hypothetical protein
MVQKEIQKKLIHNRIIINKSHYFLLVAFKTFIMTFIYLILLVIFFLCLELLYSFLFKKIEIFLFRRTKRKVEKLKEKQENI